MKGDRYARAKNIVLGAESLPEPLRAPFIDRVCSGDPDLRAEVTSLLAHRDATPPALEPGALDAVLDAALREQAPAAPAAREEPAAPEGAAGAGAGRVPFEEAVSGVHPDRIGPYRILNVLGEGGMGIVYRAEQTEPIRREVAVKLIRGDLDSARVMARFEAERQALALMSHPHIARILDAGADARGRPYFVMELVSGPPITEFCERRGLPTREKIDLFLSICDAVQHAHQRGVIHRDLKPSNILVPDVDGRPFPMIIDFGIAKALGDPLTGDGQATLDGILMGTPEYMSPEQAGSSAASVDTRTDVYALGVLLFEMLTGRRPYRLTGRSLAEIPRAILEQEPGRPSTAVRRGNGAGGTPPRRAPAARLARELRGDLDAIVLMALRKEPSLRYPSVEHFAEDLRRHAAGVPVRARRGSWRYGTGKFLRRNAVPLGLAAAAFVWLGGFAVTLATQSARVAQERDRARAAEADARREAETAREVSDFLVRLFEVANPEVSRGASVTAREILDRGTERIRRELGAEPVVQGRLLATVGEVYHALGLYAVADTVLHEALAIQERTLGRLHAEVGATLDRLGTVAHDQGAYDACLDYYERALRLRIAALGDTATEVAESYRHVAIANQVMGRLEPAEPLYRRALALNRRLRGDEDVEVAWDKNSLAWLLTQKGSYAEAEPLFRQALGTQRRLLGDRHPDVAGTMNNLAGVRWFLGAYAEAESLWRRAREVYREIYPEGHAAVARSDYNLARVLVSRGNLEEAEAYYRSGLDTARRVVGNQGPFYATHLYGLGRVLVLEGRPSEAEPLLRHSLAMRRRIYGDEHPTVATGLEAMGELELRRGRAAAARYYYAQALAIREAKQPEGHEDRAVPLLGLAQAALRSRDTATAAPLAARAVSLRTTALGAAHPLTAEARAVLDQCGTAIEAAGGRVR